MKLTFLGTGTSIGVPAIGCQCEVCRSTEPHDKRLRQSAFLETDGGIRVLIDCGPDFRQQTTRFPFTKLDAVVISHIHFDHVAGIDDLRPYCMFGDVDIYCQDDVVQALHQTMPYCFKENLYPGVPHLNLHSIMPHETFTLRRGNEVTAYFPPSGSNLAGVINKEGRTISVLPATDTLQITPIQVMHGNMPILGYVFRQPHTALAYITDMKSMDEVLEAYRQQIEFFAKWQVTMVNCYEYLYAERMPMPLLSATVEGCMESGLDVMWGGSKYTNTGNSSIGHGNVADSLNIIDQVCFRDKIATTRELYDALMADWEGYEDLHQYILGRCSHFGNNDPEADKYLKFTADTYAQAISRGVSPRGNHWTAGCWPVTLNVVYGGMVAATPDGRKSGAPLSDGISPVQSMDKSGPFATINSILKFDQSEYSNGTLCNMKFHPTALQGEGGDRKLRAVMESYFRGGGMELQINVVSADMLRAAQKAPGDYQDLVVRVAGFSAYFVEVYKEAQDDLIRRTELSV